MSHLTTDRWDELSKSLAEESLPRRESLRRIGAVLAGAVLSPLGLGTAWGAGSDPCKSFCNQQCPKSKRSQCLADCRACGNDPRGLCGTCSHATYGYYNFTCPNLANDVLNCGACFHNCWHGAGAHEETACFDGECVYWCRPGAVVCDGRCTFLESDLDNCGGCGYACEQPGPYEYGACINGRCEYYCFGGAEYCDGTCTNLWGDPDNCGACGNVCGGATPYCYGGACTDCAWGAICDGGCTDLMNDSANCGACGWQCESGTSCISGVCEGTYDGGYDDGWNWG